MVTKPNKQSNAVLTFDGLLQICLCLKPEEAAHRADSSLCVTPLINTLLVDGEVVHLKMTLGKWGALYIRVSTDRQRSGKARKTNKTKKGNKKEEGYSEEEQLIRGIRYFVDKGQAFKVYSDAGVTGEFPNNKPDLIERLLHKKAVRYEKIFTRVLLSDGAIKRRTQEEIASMRAYLNKHTEAILKGTIDEEDLFLPAEQGVDERSKRNRRGRPFKRTYHRQAFTQLWEDISCEYIHQVAVSDRSRLCRDADLETTLLEHASQHKTEIKGLIEDIYLFDISDPVQKGVSYVLASFNEKRIAELALNTFRGIVQLLESGRPHSNVTWWVKRDEEGFARLIEENAQIARRVVDLYLAGHGATAIATILATDAITVSDKPISMVQIRRMLETDVLIGNVWQFGLAWKVYPAIIDEDTFAELKEQRNSRRGATDYMRNPLNWAEHMFTGMLRCSCSQCMNHAKISNTQISTGITSDYYICARPNKRVSKETAEHAFIYESSLATFFGDIFKHSPEILTGRYASGVSGATNETRTARRAMLEQRLEQAEEEYRGKAQDADKKAHQTALNIVGISKDSANFANIVSEISRSYLEADRQTLDGIREELTRLRIEISKDKRSEQFAQAIAELGGWDNLDNLTRNRLMRSVIETIILYPRLKEAKLDIKLLGVDVILPPVRYRYMDGRHSRLPTVEEWIADMFEEPSEDVIRGRYSMINYRNMRGFFYYLRRMENEGAVGRLMQMWQDDHSLTRNYISKEYAIKELRDRNADQDMLMAFENAWTYYLEQERGRVLSGEPKKLPNKKS